MPWNGPGCLRFHGWLPTCSSFKSRRRCVGKPPPVLRSYRSSNGLSLLPVPRLPRRAGHPSTPISVRMRRSGWRRTGHAWRGSLRAANYTPSNNTSRATPQPVGNPPGTDTFPIRVSPPDCVIGLRVRMSRSTSTEPLPGLYLRGAQPVPHRYGRRWSGSNMFPQFWFIQPPVLAEYPPGEGCFSPRFAFVCAAVICFPHIPRASPDLRPHSPAGSGSSPRAFHRYHEDFRCSKTAGLGKDVGFRWHPGQMAHCDMDLQRQTYISGLSCCPVQELRRSWLFWKLKISS